MADEHKKIHALLELVHRSHNDINREVQSLWTSGRCEEADVSQLKEAVSGLYQVKQTLRDLLVLVLSPEYQSSLVRKNLLDLRLVEALRQPDGKYGVLEKFVRNDLGVR